MARCEGAIKPLVPGEIFAAKLAAINRVVPSILSLFPSFLRNIVITFCAFTFIKIKLNLLATFSKFSFVRILLYVLSTPIELIYLFCSTFIYISFFPFACAHLSCVRFLLCKKSNKIMNTVLTRITSPFATRRSDSSRARRFPFLSSGRESTENLNSAKLN